MVHIGQKIKEVQQASGISVAALARAVDCSRNNMYDIFARPTIDTGLLQRIGQKLNHDFFRYYTAGGGQPSEEPLGSENERLAKLEKKVGQLEELAEQLGKAGGSGQPAGA